MDKVRLAIFFKDFSHWVRSSCVGLNVAGYTTAKYLRSVGVNAQAHAVRHNIDVAQIIERSFLTNCPITHVVISAPWLTLYDLTQLVTHFHSIQFAVLSHSNVGFLQADPGGVELFRKYAQLARRETNLVVGGNSRAFVQWFEAAYQENCILLPNLYLVDRIRSKHFYTEKRPLRIGAFGAIRPEKNFMTAAAAAVAMHAHFGTPTELHMSTGGDGCKAPVLPAIEEMCEGIAGFKLIRHHWTFWDQFVHLISRMDLMIQVSYTESFNMVTADAISKGVPVVVSPVIYWAPPKWMANPDDALDVARVGIRLLKRPQGYRGADALLDHDRRSLEFWLDFLS